MTYHMKAHGFLRLMMLIEIIVVPMSKEKSILLEKKSMKNMKILLRERSPNVFLESEIIFI